MLKNTLGTPYGQGVEQFLFSDGSSLNREQMQEIAWISSTGGNDILQGTNSSEAHDIFLGGTGDDTIISWSGRDTYVYAEGDGNDYIDDENASTTDIDVLRFTDLDAGDLTFSRADRHLEIRVNSTGHVITLDEQMISETDYWGIEKIEFADGTSWNREQIREAAWIRGTSGSDTLLSEYGDDTIETGAGNDIIVFRPDFGLDKITDFQAGAGLVDVLEFDNSLFDDFQDVLASAAQVGTDTVISYDASNVVTLKNVAMVNLHADDFRFVA